MLTLTITPQTRRWGQASICTWSSFFKNLLCREKQILIHTHKQSNFYKWHLQICEMPPNPTSKRDSVCLFQTHLSQKDCKRHNKQESRHNAAILPHQTPTAARFIWRIRAEIDSMLLRPKALWKPERSLTILKWSIFSSSFSFISILWECTMHV